MKYLIPALLLLTAAIHAADTAPDWAMELSTRALPSYSGDVRSVTLLDESHVTVYPDSRLTTEQREAVRILNVEGRRDAIATIAYLKGSSKIRGFHAWLISPGGSVKAYGKESIIDAAVKQDFELYDEVRMRVIEARNPEAGATFAWTATWDAASLVPQADWSFQGREPVLLSRYILTLPAGWRAQSSTFNHAPVEPLIQGATYTWALTNLPLIKNENASPRFSSLVPWMGVTFGPQQEPKKFTTWSDVSQWLSTLDDSQANPDDAIAAKVHELTASAPTNYAKIQAIGHYVQKLKYVAIEMNLARGGGYQPHAASAVYKTQYGDCKDKANLMKAMLKAAGIDSYLISIYSGDRDHVKPEWASPQQFNHAILAVKVSEDVQAMSIVQHPVLGRLLIFDATDSNTPVGDLPLHEQGSYALVIAGARGDCLKMPVAAPEMNRTDVNISATLLPTGEVDGSYTSQSIGQSAADLRRMRSYLDDRHFREGLEHWFGSSAKLITLHQVDAKDEFEKEKFALNVSFAAPVYAQVMQQRMLVFKPSLIQRWNEFESQSDRRANPVVLEPQCYHKQVHIKLPPGFTIDELPDPASLSTSFGKFSSTYKVNGDDLLFTEELDVTATTLPPERYTEAKDFFEHVGGAEQAPVVLMKN